MAEPSGEQLQANIQGVEQPIASAQPAQNEDSLSDDLEDRLRDPTVGLCDFCATLYVKEVPPKRPLSPFIFFSQEQRKILKSKNSQWSTKQVMKHLQKTWRNMLPEQSEKYREMSEMDRVRYDKHRRLLKQELMPDMRCTCKPMGQPADKRLSSDIKLSRFDHQQQPIAPLAQANLQMAQNTEPNVAQAHDSEAAQESGKAPTDIEEQKVERVQQQSSPPLMISKTSNTNNENQEDASQAAPIVLPKIQYHIKMKIGQCNYLEFGEKEAAAAFTTGDNSSGQLEPQNQRATQTKLQGQVIQQPSSDVNNPGQAQTQTQTHNRDDKNAQQVPQTVQADRITECAVENTDQYLVPQLTAPQMRQQMQDLGHASPLIKQQSQENQLQQFFPYPNNQCNVVHSAPFGFHNLATTHPVQFNLNQAAQAYYGGDQGPSPRLMVANRYSEMYLARSAEEDTANRRRQGPATIRSGVAGQLPVQAGQAHQHLLLLDEKDASENLFSQQPIMIAALNNSVLQNMHHHQQQQQAVHMSEHAAQEQNIKTMHSMVMGAGASGCQDVAPTNNVNNMAADSEAMDMRNEGAIVMPEDNLYPELEDQNQFVDQQGELRQSLGDYQSQFLGTNQVQHNDVGEPNSIFSELFPELGQPFPNSAGNCNE